MSLPTPPAGTLDRDQPWYRGRISDAQWDRLKAKLTGGTDAGGTSYSKIIDCSSSEADKIISNMKKDPRGYPQINNPGGAEGYENMYNYYTFLKDAYLYDEPKPEPEEIPVEVEVVEVEQKTVDEPIVIKIEAPFEPAPEAPKLSAPKRVRLPRRSGLMKARPIGPAKKSSAERMSEAFDKNLLGPLVDSIQNPPAPAPPRQRKQKETLAKVKRSVKPKSRFKETNNVKPLENTSLFVFNKVKSAFGRAADARRMAQEQGLPEQEKRFYIKRALGFEFGGDAIARTRGTFSKSPDATLDPSLTKQQRYTQGLFGTRTIRPPAKTKDTSGNIDTITKKISDLEKQFDNLIEIKKVSSDSKDSTGDLSKTLDDLKNALKKGSKHQKDINASKKKLLDLEAKAADAAQADVEEAELDKTQDLSDFVKNAEKKEKEEEEGKSKDDGGGGGFRRWLKNFRRTAGKWWRRIRNPRKTWQAIKRLTKQKLKKIPGVKGLNNWMKRNKPFQGLRNVFNRNRPTSTPGVKPAVKPPSSAGNFLSRLNPKNLNLGRLKNLNLGRLKNLKPTSARGGIASVAMLGLDLFMPEIQDGIAGLYGKMGFGIQKQSDEQLRYEYLLAEHDAARMKSGPLGIDTFTDSSADPRATLKREFERRGLSLPTYSGTAPIPPSTKKDTEQSLEKYGGIPEGYKLDENGKIVKMASGGTVKLAGGGVNAMIGEAGPEMLLRAGEGGMNPLQSLAPIIASLREVTKRAGTWADPVENMVRQITDPIAKSLKLPVVPMNVDIDKDPKSTKKKTNGFFGKLSDLFKGGGDKEGKDSSSETASDSSSPAVTPYDGDVDMGGGAGRTTAGAVYNYLLSKGMSENHAKGITVNISRESGFKLGAHGDPDAGGSFGLFQWNMAAGRGGPMMAAVPDWRTNWKAQIDYALQEQTGPQYLRTQFRSAGEAAYWWMANWEIPAARIQREYTPAKYEAMIQKMNLHRGMPVAPPVRMPSTGGGRSSNISIVGDSVAQGFVLSGANRGGRNNAVQGRNPQQVEAALKSTVRRGNTGHVVLSTGLSNNPGMMSDVKDQMAYLQSQNISFTVLPLASTVQNSAALNNQLRNLAPQYGGRYASQVQGFAVAADGYNAHMAHPMTEYRKLRLGGS